VTDDVLGFGDPHDPNGDPHGDPHSAGHDLDLPAADPLAHDPAGHEPLGPEPSPGGELSQDLDHDRGHDLGHDLRHSGELPADLATDPATDPADPATDPATDPAAGLLAGHDDGPFPVRLDVDVETADGLDWVDPELLGNGPAGFLADPLPPYAPRADLLADLHHAAGSDGAASWESLAGSDDPAVRALAMHWRGAE